jgi:hypothetical protein
MVRYGTVPSLSSGNGTETDRYETNAERYGPLSINNDDPDPDKSGTYINKNFSSRKGHLQRDPNRNGAADPESFNIVKNTGYLFRIARLSMDPDPNTLDSELFNNVNNRGYLFRNTFSRMDPGSNTATDPKRSGTDIKKEFFFRTTPLNTLLSTNLCNKPLILGSRNDNNIYFMLPKIFLGKQLSYVRC